MGKTINESHIQITVQTESIEKLNKAMECLKENYPNANIRVELTL